MSIHPTFDDLLHLRTGSDRMTAGGDATRVETLATLEQWQTKAAALRELYQWTLGVKPDDYDRPLDLRIDSEKPGDGFTRRTVSYNVGPDERVTADVCIPPGDKLPAVLTLHPTNAIGREQSVGADTPHYGVTCAYGLHLAQRGYVTISYDMLGAGDRIYPGLKYFDNTPFIAQYPQWSGRGKDLHDLSRAIDVLEQTPEVDASRIGAIGHSQGGGLTTDGMAVDERIKVGVDNCGEWPFRLMKNPFGRCRDTWWIGQPALRPFALTGKAMPIDLHEKLALAAPRAQMMIVALNDFTFGETDEWLTRPTWHNLAAAVRRVYDLYGRGDALDLSLHTKGHTFDDTQREAAYAFLDKHLKQG